MIKEVLRTKGQAPFSSRNLKFLSISPAAANKNSLFFLKLKYLQKLFQKLKF